MPRTVHYIAVSVNGLSADKEGGVGWLDPHHSLEPIRGLWSVP